MDASLASLAAEKYVSLTTFKRDGTPVATPVWVAADGDGLAVITEAASWKVKRLRNDPRVELAPCDVRGRTKAGGRRYGGTAEVVTGPEADRIRGLIARKYGLIANAVEIFYAVRNFVRRRPASESAGIVVKGSSSEA
jgi:PPOX class probable F420-dependent enzyme